MERKINILFIDTSYANKNPLQYLNENKKIDADAKDDDISSYDLLFKLKPNPFRVYLNILWTHSEMFESRTLVPIHSIGRRQKQDYRAQMLYIKLVVIRRISGLAREPTVREDSIRMVSIRDVTDGIW